MVFSFRPYWKPIIIFSVLLTLYFATRFSNLTALPIFTDEAIYIRWSQIGSRDPNWRFISLTDGKQPMFTWIMMVVMRFIPEPLYAGRLVSVLAGLGSLIGVWLVSWELFQNKRLSLIASFLYIISPFSTMYDRMALYDSLVVTFYLGSLYLAILLVRKNRLDVALILGMTLGLGILNKTSGFLSLYLLPTTLLLFDRKEGKGMRRLGIWIFLVGVAATLSFIMYSSLRLSPLFQMVSQKDGVFVYSLKEWLSHPFLVLVGNFRGMFDWLRGYITFPLLLCSFLAFIRYWHKPLEKILLLSWWFLPFVALALFGRVLYPRFILFMSMTLIILAAYSLEWLYTRWGKTVFGIVLLSSSLFPSIYTSYYIVTNPIHAPIPQADRGQFIDDWPAGWGIKEVNSFLLELSISRKVSVYTEGTFGLLPYAVEMYLVDNPNITIRGLWPVIGSMPATMNNDAHDHPTYLVLNQSQKPPEGWKLSQLAEYQKGRNPDVKLRLYQVLPNGLQ